MAVLGWVRRQEEFNNVPVIILIDPEQTKIRIAVETIFYKQLHLVKIMIRRFGRETLSTYCQTLNGCEIVIESLKTIAIFIGI
jgi:hypothetical protein